MSSQFDATASMLGYLFQVRLALLDSLGRLRAVGSFSVALETFDDVAFQAQGSPLELLQPWRLRPLPGPGLRFAHAGAMSQELRSGTIKCRFADLAPALTQCVRTGEWIRRLEGAPRRGVNQRDGRGNLP
jgi:hypothetical protein